jgi:murein DD-endopeptidase MepM/ murein hydrolase activator NlpD
MPVIRRPQILAALAALALALGIAGVAGSAPTTSEEKADVDAKLARAESRVAQARQRENVLTSQVAAFSADIRELEARLAPLRREAERLEAREAELRARLDALTERLSIERVRLARAQDTLDQRRLVLAQRLRDVYVRGEPDPILVLIESESVSSAIDTATALERVIDGDRRLVGSVRARRNEIKRTRDKIDEVRADVAVAERQAAAAADEARAATDELERKRAAVDRLLDGRRTLLSQARGNRAQVEAEAKNLQQRSAALGAKIVAAQQNSVVPAAPGAPSGSVPSGPASAAGFVFPASGSLTSGFGPRWGRMHEGIDIAAPTGTPIIAAQAGTVIIAGWQGGYGNLTVIDHGGGVSTAYGHQSSIGVSVGQSVGQGQVIGAMGSTGNSTGPHLHFEVRINGGAVNPLGYL